MEACASAHYWGQEIAALGHEVRLVPPIYVKPFVKRHKHDAADAEGITEAAQRPTMHFVAVYGYRHGSRYERNARDMHAFLDNPYLSLVPAGATTADRYSRIAASLRAKGRRIPTNDLWIAAHAMETGPIWCRPPATSSMCTGSRGFG